MAIRVFVVDKQPVFCAGIRAVLATIDDLQLIGEVNSLHQLCSYKIKDSPDILLIDADLVVDSLYEAVNVWKQKFGSSKILLLTNSDETCVRQLMAQGVDGCLLRSEPPQVVVEAIQVIAQGERCLANHFGKK
jgi:DNA-binding NarL/FixJ family response regulator